MKPSSAVAFEYTRVPYGDDGNKVRGVIVRCSAPGCAETVQLPVNNMSSKWTGDTDEVEWHFVAKKLEKLGWRIGKARTAHRCPDCFKKAKFSAINKSKAAAAATIAPTNGVAAMEVVATARSMGREDRRIIFEKLNEVYADEKTGYTDTWTDEKVASHLGVPRAWVRTIREENFGDEITNGDIRAKITEAQQALAQMKAFEPDLRKLLGMADRIERTLGEIQKVLK